MVPTVLRVSLWGEVGEKEGSGSRSPRRGSRPEQASRSSVRALRRSHRIWFPVVARQRVVGTPGSGHASSVGSTEAQRSFHRGPRRLPRSDGEPSCRSGNSNRGCGSCGWCGRGLLCHREVAHEESWPHPFGLRRPCRCCRQCTERASARLPVPSDACRTARRRGASHMCLARGSATARQSHYSGGTLAASMCLSAPRSQRSCGFCGQSGVSLRSSLLWRERPCQTEPLRGNERSCHDRVL
mmetsp:Transcript_65172/g.172667  ORF Transcript_65172/g.172667 Transcript_65172/m.172667 type:complete len:241 (-) Transcript_65172:662-1384(-)